MKRALQVISFAALCLTLAGPLLFFTGDAELPRAQVFILLGTATWFLSAPFWMEHRRS